MEGDLLTFKRKFTALGVVLEKEALVSATPGISIETQLNIR